MFMFLLDYFSPQNKKLGLSINIKSYIKTLLSGLHLYDLGCPWPRVGNIIQIVISFKGGFIQVFLVTSVDRCSYIAASERTAIDRPHGCWWARHPPWYALHQGYYT